MKFTLKTYFYCVMPSNCGLETTLYKDNALELAFSMVDMHLDVYGCLLKLAVT